MKPAKKPAPKKLFVAVAAAIAVAGLSFSTAVQAGAKPEKEDLKFGFIKLTDMAPLAVAAEKGFFEDEGLFVQLEAQANWKVVMDRVVNGELDGSHMLAAAPWVTARATAPKPISSRRLAWVSTVTRLPSPTTSGNK